MDLNLRKAIKNIMGGKNEGHKFANSVDAVQSGEEKMLPGLGVLFEMLWQGANEKDKKYVLDILEQETNQL